MWANQQAGKVGMHVGLVRGLNMTPPCWAYDAKPHPVVRCTMLVACNLTLVVGWARLCQHVRHFYSLVSYSNKEQL